MCVFFLSIKFATSLLALLAGDKKLFLSNLNNNGQVGEECSTSFDCDIGYVSMLPGVMKDFCRITDDLCYEVATIPCNQNKGKTFLKNSLFFLFAINFRY